MTDDTINPTNSQKMSVYCKTCVCKGCHTGQELYNQGMWHGMAIGSKEELDRLKAENERLKEEFRIESLTDKTTGETIYRSNLVNKYRIILQDIMVIAEDRTKTEDYLLGQEYTDLVDKILELITKAEEE